MQGNNRDLVIEYIRVSREAMNQSKNENRTTAEIGDTTGDTGTVAEITAKETRKVSITETSQDLVAEILEIEMGTTLDGAVLKLGMIQSPTPPPPIQAEISERRSDHLGRS